MRRAAAAAVACALAAGAQTPTKCELAPAAVCVMCAAVVRLPGGGASVRVFRWND